MPPAWVLEEMGESEALRVSEPEVSKAELLKEDEKTCCETESETSEEDISVVHAGNDKASKVRFDLQPSMQLVRARHELSDAEFNETWFRASDFASIASWNRMTVRMFREHAKETGSNDIEDDLGDQCLRGLEHRLKGANAQRNEIKTNSIYAVLGEQARRRREGLPQDHDSLARMYSEHCYACVSIAFNRGKKDELAAKDLPKIEAESMERHRPVRRRAGMAAFDDSDVYQLRSDLSAGGDHAVPVVTDYTYDLEDDESFRTKAKREKLGSIAFKSFFGKKSKEETDSSSEGRPQRRTSVGQPQQRRTSIGQPQQRRTSIGQPQSSRSEGRPQRRTSIGQPQNSRQEGRPQRRTSIGQPQNSRQEGRSQRRESIGRRIGRRLSIGRKSTTTPTPAPEPVPEPVQKQVQPDQPRRRYRRGSM